MKYLKKKNDTTTVRKVWSDDREVCYGVIGTVSDLLQVGILDYCDCPTDKWCFLPAPGIMHKAKFGRTREEVVEGLPDQLKRGSSPRPCKYKIHILKGVKILC